MGAQGFAKQRLCRMNEVMERFVDREEVSGIVTAVRRYGETHIETFGTKEFGGKAPMQRDTIFRIASLTKPVTAVAALILVEECRLRLDDPVDDLLPELANRRVLKSIDGEVGDTVPANRPITLRDLLTFRAGYGVIMAKPGTYPIQQAAIDAGFPSGPPRPQSYPTTDEWMRRLGTLPLLHQPGEQWRYHTASDILGVLIQRCVGKPLEAFFQERIFGPLGMKDTGFFVPAEKIGRLATQYAKNWQTGKNEVFDAPEGGDWSRPPAFESGGGGLVSTVDDFLAFGEMLMNNGRFGHERILSRPSVLAMTTDQLTDAQKGKGGLLDGYFESRGWGFGVSVVTRRTEVAGTVGMYGWDGGFGTSWGNDPDENLQCILLTQQAWTSPNPPCVCKDFWTSAYQAIAD